MNALVLTLFISLSLAGLGVLGFFAAARQRDHDHSDRLSLLPLDDDEAGAPTSRRMVP